MRRPVLALLLALALIAPSAAYAGPPPRTSLPDIEDEVMCVECGTPLAVSDSPVANQERALIRKLIAQGRTKAQIKAALVREYGTAVLADPKRHGFGNALWLVPIALVLLGGTAIVLALRRWRRNGPAPETPLPPELSPEDARRLDADLSR
jgi:cytochrome c-type biogenesis protein CcmH/NrfF